MPINVHPATPEEALDNARQAAENATADAYRMQSNFPGTTSQVWSRVSMAWATYAGMLPTIKMMDKTNRAADAVLMLDDLTKPGTESVSPATTVHGEETLIKVRRALSEAIMGLTEQSATDIIATMQNHGILFRERPFHDDITDEEAETIRALRDGTAVVQSVKASATPQITKVGEVSSGELIDRETIQAMRAFLGIFLDHETSGSITVSVKDFVTFAQSHFRIERQDDYIRLVALG